MTFPLTCRCLLLSLIICSPTATPRQKSSSTATETADSTSRPVWPQWCNHERELWTGRCDRQKWGSDKLPPPPHNKTPRSIWQKSLKCGSRPTQRSARYEHNELRSWRKDGSDRCVRCVCCVGRIQRFSLRQTPALSKRSMTKNITRVPVQ